MPFPLHRLQRLISLFTPLLREILTLDTNEALLISPVGIKSSSLAVMLKDVFYRTHDQPLIDLPFEEIAIKTCFGMRTFRDRPEDGVVEITPFQYVKEARRFTLDYVHNTGIVGGKREVPLEYKADPRSTGNAGSLSIPNTEFAYDPELFLAFATLKSRDIIPNAIRLTGVEFGKLPEIDLPNLLITADTENSIVIL